MNAFRRFFDSTAGRFFLLLILGVSLAAFAAFAAADAAQRESFRRLRVDWTAERIADAVNFFNGSTPSQRQGMLSTGLVGLREAPPGEPGKIDDELTARIRELSPAPTLLARSLNSASCLSGQRGPAPPPPLTCWRISATLRDGQMLEAVHVAPPLPSVLRRLLDPIYLSVLGLATAMLAFFVAYLSAQPLNRLARAARDLGENLERAPLPLEGPSEVRAASQAFNMMQSRLKETVAERTRMLGSITHDLQTPLTRMRLRVEKVRDTDLRERLVSDIAAMQLLIAEGLDLARSADTAEDWSIVDLRSLVETLVEDALDAGHRASLSGACAVDLRARPQALRRCLQNLIDNAIAYGGDAEVSCEVDNGLVSIRIRDHGPGIPEQELDRIFEPFYRLEESRSRETGGSGLGLTIARTLAAKNDAALLLHNHPEGGLEANLQFKKGSLMGR